MKIYTDENQTLFPIEFEGEFYFVRFVRHGSKLDCSGVFRFLVVDITGRLRPDFLYENKSKRQIQKVIAEARKQFEKSGIRALNK
jgi:hypothetical protein